MSSKRKLVVSGGVACARGAGLAYSTALGVLATGRGLHAEDNDEGPTAVLTFVKRPHVGFQASGDPITFRDQDGVANIYGLAFSEGPTLRPVLIATDLDTRQAHAIDVVSRRYVGNVVNWRRFRMPATTDVRMPRSVDARGALVVISNGYYAILVVLRGPEDAMGAISWTGLRWIGLNLRMDNPRALRFSSDGQEVAVAEGLPCRVGVMDASHVTEGSERWLYSLLPHNRGETVMDVVQDEEGAWHVNTDVGVDEDVYGFGEPLHLGLVPGLGIVGRAPGFVIDGGWATQDSGIVFLQPTQEVLMWAMSDLRVAWLCAWYRSKPVYTVPTKARWHPRPRTK
jgi:hypothetical protein